jgi:hypothetical protein
MRGQDAATDQQARLVAEEEAEEKLPCLRRVT